jgi:hypothetical protein
MSMSPEIRAVLERRIERLRRGRDGLETLIDAAIGDPSLSARLASVMGDRWVSVLVTAKGAATDEALSIEFELRHPPGACEPKGAAS